MDQRRQFISLADAATNYGVSSRTLRRWIASGRLPAYRLGPRLVKIDPVDLDRLAARIPAAAGR
jgi:excisionase family DNA binding protein